MAKFEVSAMLYPTPDCNRFVADDKVKVSGEIEIIKSSAFDYGNGKCMYVSLNIGTKHHMEQAFDIRYDTNYNPEDEVRYITEFIRSYWNGEGLSWKAKYIRVRERFALR